MENIAKSGLDLNPFYVTGFSDGEACFHLAIGKNAKYKIGYYVNPGFSIALHKKDENLLRKIQEFFGGIGVLRVKENIVQFRVFSIKDLDIIIKHFDSYPLISKKLVDYLLFKEALELIKNKEHLTIEGFNKIISIRASMNLGLPEILKKDFSNIKSREISASNPNFARIRVTLPDKLNPDWIAGFTEAEGCFFIKLVKNNTKKKYQVVLGYQITQHSRDALLIEKFTTFFNCGRFELTKGSSVNFLVNKFSDITKIMVPFFENYPLLGSKSKDFEDWKKVATFMISKAHLTEEGIEEISKIKLGMNSSRFFVDDSDGASQGK